MSEQVSPGVRWFVRIFLAAFVTCAIFGIELWPLTGFRLFSHLRHEHVAAWQAETVDADGVAAPLELTELPRAYQGLGPVMDGFSSRSDGDRDDMCRAWLEEARRIRPGVREVRIFRVEWDALPRRGPRPARITRRLAVACG